MKPRTAKQAKQAKRAKMLQSLMVTVPLGIIIALFILLVVANFPSSEPEKFVPPTIVGTVVEKVDIKPFSMPKGVKGEAKTTADLQGKITLLCFWRTDCGPCLQELPLLSVIANHFAKDSDFQVWTVLAADNANDKKVEKAFAQAAALVEADAKRRSKAKDKDKIKVKISLPVYTRSGPVLPEQLLPPGVPAVLLIGPDGVVAGGWEGFNPHLCANVFELVEQLRAPNPEPAEGN